MVCLLTNITNITEDLLPKKTLEKTFRAGQKPIQYKCIHWMVEHFDNNYKMGIKREEKKGSTGTAFNTYTQDTE
jgi:hypothetical protein